MVASALDDLDDSAPSCSPAPLGVVDKAVASCVRVGPDGESGCGSGPLDHDHDHDHDHDRAPAVRDPGAETVTDRVARMWVGRPAADIAARPAVATAPTPIPQEGQEGQEAQP